MHSGGSRRKARLLGAVILLAVSLAGPPPDVLAQNLRQEAPIPESTKQSLTAIENSFLLTTTQPRLTMFPQMREQMKDAPAFLRDSTGTVDFRTYFRDAISNSAPGRADWKESWAAGGSVSWQSGRIADLISGGMVLYTSFPVYAPLDRDGAQLLLPGQQQYGVVGQLYGMVHIGDDHEFVAGRYRYDTPFLGPQDNRMSPKTFYGYTVKGRFGNPETGPALRYGGGYIAAMKDRNATEFVAMSLAAGAAEPRGTGVAGGMFRWGPVRIGAIEYYTQDTINIAYAEAKVGHALDSGLHATLAAQFVDQRSIGANLLNGGAPFATNQFGLQGQLGYETAILTLAYTSVNPGFNIQTPWSANPFYTDALVNSFNLAGENTFMAGASLGFRPLGLPGVAASVFYFNGSSSAPAAGAPLTQYEWNYVLDWQPDWKPLQGLWFRGQYGHSSTTQGNVVTTGEEIRVTLNYRVKIYCGACLDLDRHRDVPSPRGKSDDFTTTLLAVRDGRSRRIAVARLRRSRPRRVGADEPHVDGQRAGPAQRALLSHGRH